MPHLVILYTSNLDPQTDMTELCRKLANTMLAVHDDDGKQIFPTGGVRVLAYPAAHFAVADGQRDYSFVYLNLRMGRGRSDAIKKRAGEVLLSVAKAHLEPLFAQRYVGVTMQIDEGAEVFNGRHSNIHPLFAAG